MTIDELIEELKKAKEQYGGNMEVVIWTEGQWCPIQHIDKTYNMLGLMDNFSKEWCNND